VAIQPLTAHDAAKASTLLAETFLAAEPMTVALQENSVPGVGEAMRAVAKEMVEAMMPDSFVLKSGETVLGLCLNLPYPQPEAAPAESAPEEKSPLDPIFEVLGALSAHPQDGRGLEVVMLATSTDPSYKGKGIAKALVQQALAKAHADGVAFVITKATNVGSQKVFASAGFTTQASQAYASFESSDDGTRPFARIPDAGTESANLMRFDIER
jgi:ribosomal protein S18 acetylase RimI-like enzyme